MTDRPPTGVFITGVADELYEPCLVALIEALDLLANAHWHAWMVDDLERWRRRRDVTHHRSAYGGMGSFNDLWFSSGDAWADETAETLREAIAGISAAVAREPTRIFAEGASIDGRKVLVVEDVIITGGQVAESTRELRDRDDEVSTVLCVIDRSCGGHQVLDDEGTELMSLVAAADLQQDDPVRLSPCPINRKPLPAATIESAGHQPRIPSTS